MIFPKSLLRERVSMVEDRLGEQGLKFLVVYSNGSSSGTGNRTHGYLRYLCDWDSRSAASVLVLRLGEAPVLLVPNSYYQRLAGENMWFEDIRKVPQARLGGEIASILQPLVSANEKIGYIGRAETPAPVYDALSQALAGVEWVQADRIIDELRTIKDPVAMIFHRRAAEICDAMFETLTREVRRGKKAYQLHPNVFIPNEAAGVIGDMVLVTEDGYEILNGFPRELIIW